MIVVQFVIMDLTSGEGESLAEGHDEVLDVVYNFFLDDPLIDVLIPLSQLLDVDIVQQVLILEHLYGPEGLLVIRNGL